MSTEEQHVSMKPNSRHLQPCTKALLYVLLKVNWVKSTYHNAKADGFQDATDLQHLCWVSVDVQDDLGPPKQLGQVLSVRVHV